MNEGEFPAPVSASNLLDETHLTALTAAGLDLALPPRATEDELWASARTRATTSLTGWRTLLDDSGRSRAPSLFFGALKDAHAEPLSVPAEPALAAAARELEVACVRTWELPGPARPSSPHWQAIRAAATVERIRRSFTAGGAAEGDLREVALASTIATDRWSATRFESYLTCPFQFFGHYVMRLSELDEETREADAAVRGTVVHDILEAAAKPLVEAQQPINSATLPRLLKFLETEGEQIWNAAPATFGFGRAGLWRLQWPRVLGDLCNLLRREAAFSEEHGVRRVVATEMKLGTLLPLDPPVTFGGSADRVDEGDGFIVVSDYKSGKEISRKEVDEARRVQLQLYGVAAMAATGQPHVIGRYVPLRPTKDSALWEIDSRKGTPIDAGLAAAQGVLDQVAARSFYVNPTPTACPPYCSFIRACRVNQFSRSKWPSA
ncbi:MAG: PD-(D/E)XK nuclease family protein [Tepidiformaceae bacterium]